MSPGLRMVTVLYFGNLPVALESIPQRFIKRYSFTKK